MNTLVRGLTLCTVFLFLWQFVGPKGTTLHILKGVSVGVFAILSVIINTVWVMETRGLTWDFPFVLHIGFGVAFIIFWGFTVVAGYSRRMYGRDMFFSHRELAHIQGVLLALTVIAGINIPLLRSILTQ
ncbi:MAG TPA: hypothetical protein VJH33_03365 [Candidatus Paceibacterota bacterium]